MASLVGEEGHRRWRRGSCKQRVGIAWKRRENTRAVLLRSEKGKNYAERDLKNEITGDLSCVEWEKGKDRWKMLHAAVYSYVVKISRTWYNKNIDPADFSERSEGNAGIEPLWGHGHLYAVP